MSGGVWIRGEMDDAFKIKGQNKIFVHIDTMQQGFGNKSLYMLMKLQLDVLLSI